MKSRPDDTYVCLPCPVVHPNMYLYICKSNMVDNNVSWLQINNSIQIEQSQWSIKNRSWSRSCDRKLAQMNLLTNYDCFHHVWVTGEKNRPYTNATGISLSYMYQHQWTTSSRSGDVPCWNADEYLELPLHAWFS